MSNKACLEITHFGFSQSISTKLQNTVEITLTSAGDHFSDLRGLSISLHFKPNLPVVLF